MTRLARPPSVAFDPNADPIDVRTISRANRAQHSTVRAMSDELTGAQVIVLEGEFDLANVWELDRAIERGIEAGARDFVADLSKVDFIDATTIHALLRGWKRAARRNGRFVLVDPPGATWRVFVLIGVSRTFMTFASPEEALTYLR